MQSLLETNARDNCCSFIFTLSLSKLLQSYYEQHQFDFFVLAFFWLLGIILIKHEMSRSCTIAQTWKLKAKSEKRYLADISSQKLKFRWKILEKHSAVIFKMVLSWQKKIKSSCFKISKKTPKVIRKTLKLRFSFSITFLVYRLLFY